MRQDLMLSQVSLQLPIRWGDLELRLSSLHLQFWDHRHVTTCDLGSAEDGPWGFVHAEQVSTN